MASTDGPTRKSVMGWGNRGWVEIIELILEVCEKGALKTHIMYRCNLNSKQIEQYLHFLHGHNLIDMAKNLQSSSRPVYITTTVGKKYIEAYKLLESVFEEKID
ncbi:MAG: hypothetical protein KGI33_07595 [Thaumarchaeota archaeon]|nr:hypothetical protein [Nitrososphaerota archaeon]